MFGCIVAGRLVQTNLIQVDEAKFLFELSDPASINHIVVFMLGTITFPEGLAATVHFLWPSRHPSWKLLGMISNEKPSAIFKLGAKEFIKNASDMNMDQEDFSGEIIQLGISIEPINVVMAQMDSLKTAQGLGSALVLRSNDNTSIALNVLESFYNYCSSFPSIPTKVI